MTIEEAICIAEETCIAKEFSEWLEDMAEKYGWNKNDVQALIKQFLMICEGENGMKVEAEVKIKILDGEEQGKTDTFTTVGETDTTYTEYGIIESLLLEWKYIHNAHLVNKPQEEKSCSNCKFWCLDINDENRRCKYCYHQDEWQAESEEQA